MIGMGESTGHVEDRALEAIQMAFSSPLLEVDISTANGVLVNVVGGPDMTIGDAQKVAEEVQKRVSPNARIIWGAGVDPAPGAQDPGDGGHRRSSLQADPRQVQRAGEAQRFGSRLHKVGDAGRKPLC